MTDVDDGVRYAVKVQAAEGKPWGWVTIPGQAVLEGDWSKRFLFPKKQQAWGTARDWRRIEKALAGPGEKPGRVVLVTVRRISKGVVEKVQRTVVHCLTDVQCGGKRFCNCPCDDCVGETKE